jgi:hypothetical protein
MPRQQQLAGTAVCTAAHTHVMLFLWVVALLCVCLVPQWPCMGRETLYAAGYLGLCPILYDKLKASSTFKVTS